jgi:hypothetical protein
MSRRTVLRGAGGVALSLPLLDAMAPRRAHAAAGPRRMAVMFQPNGTIASAWRPTGGETDFVLSPILKPLEPYRNDILVIRGLNQMGLSGSCNHAAGTVGLLTGRPNHAPNIKGWGTGISVDQYVAAKIGSATRFPSLELSVSSDIYPGGPDDKSRICFRGPDQPVPPEQSPYKLFTRLFGDGTADNATLMRLTRKRKSILDFVLDQVKGMQQKVGSEDARRLDWHATAVRDIEKQLADLSKSSPACAPPVLGPPVRIGQPGGAGLDAAFQPVGKLQMDMMFTAFVCDLTRVATLQWSTGGGIQIFTWLGHKANHHGLGHEPDSNTEAMAQLVQINVWFAEQFAYLVGKMKAVREGEGTMLDNTALLWGNELAKGNSHALNDAAFVLAGRGGGYFKTGRYLQVSGKVPHNNLLVSMMNAMGLPDTTFGQADWCTGPLRELMG